MLLVSHLDFDVSIHENKQWVATSAVWSARLANCKTWDTNFWSRPALRYNTLFCISCTGHDPPTFSTNLVRSDEEIDEIMWVQEMATVYCFFQQTAQQVLRGFSSTAFRSSFLLPNSFRKRIPTNEFPNSLPWTCFFIELRPSNFSSFFYLCGLAF